MAFNNAGIMVPPTDAADESAEQFDRVSAINLRGVWACMKHELRQMREQGSGAIVNNSSLGGLVGNPGRAAYHASKHGILGLTKSAALEYAPRGVRINAVCPGTIETPMVEQMIASGELDMDQAMAAQPIARLGTADEMAAAVAVAVQPRRQLRSRRRPPRRRRLHRAVGMRRKTTTTHPRHPLGAPRSRAGADLLAATCSRLRRGRRGERPER